MEDAAAAVGLAIALSACTPRDPKTPVVHAAPPPATPLEGGATVDDAAHLLNRLTFGPRAGQAAALATSGLAPWLAVQLVPEKIDDAPGRAALAPFADAITMLDDLDKKEIVRSTQMSAIARHVASERQVLEVLVDFWTNHFSVSLQKGAVRYLAADFVERAVRPFALGSFADLLAATARHPAMLVYLDNAQSVAPPPNSPQAKKGRGLNENYARELLELHTVGVGGGYSQDDVIAVARILSGWSVADDEFVFRTRMHDTGAKTVMGHAFAAGGGEEEGRALLAFLAAHPSTAEHLCRQLCARLVADTPPPAVVAAAVAAWRASNGRIADVVHAIVASPAFWAADVRRAKIKSPLELVVSAVRAVDGTVDGDGLAKVLARMGQAPLLAPAPTGYADTTDAWLSTAGALERMDLALGLAAGKLPGVRVPLDRVLPLPSRESLPDWRARTLDLIAALVPGGLAPRTQQVLATWISRAKKPAEARTIALALALASPEFQRQ